MERLIECDTCGYPLTPEEREGLVEINGKMCKPRKPLTDEEIDKCWYQSGGVTPSFARAIEQAHKIGEK
jgi:hypothetical protein